MRVLYYDCFSGISGDMNLGAMIDLGVEVSYLKDELGKLNLGGWDLVAETDQRHGIKGTKVTVKQLVQEHSHRHLADIENIIKSSSLSDSVRKVSMEIFMKIATAESAVHGIPVEKVPRAQTGKPQGRRSAGQAFTQDR